VTRRARLTLSVVFVLETSLYSAIVPLLPHYEETLHLDKAAVGILSAAYAVGIVVGSIIGAALVSRWGVRAITLGGLVGLAALTVGFAFAETIVLLDVLRLAQGMASGCLWAGGFAWLLGATDRERRGATVGAVMSAAVIGTLIGPVLGTAAAELGIEPVAAGIAAGALVAALAVLPIPAPAAPVEAGRPIREVLRARPVRLGLWLTAFPGAIIGMVNTLAPLRLADLGASKVVIGAAFLASSAVAVAVSPAIGRLADREGVMPSIRRGLLVMAACLMVAVVPLGPAALILVIVACLGVGLMLAWVPSIAWLTDVAQHAGATAGLAAACVNVSLSLGESVGSPVTAAAADGFGTDAVPLLAMALISAATVAALRAAGRGAVPASAPSAPDLRTPPAAERARP
jgi:MFS family permease